MKIVEQNMVTGEIIERDATPEEIAEKQAINDQREALMQAAEAAAAKKAAILAALAAAAGLDPDDVAQALGV